MSLVLIRGRYYVTKYSPDGDSIRFRANNRMLWSKLNTIGSNLNINNRLHVQLRFEGVDAPETHFTNGGEEGHQPLSLARAARDEALSFLGITGVVWNSKQTEVSSAVEGSPGYILARQLDDNGRALAYSFAGDPTEEDGSDIFMTVDRMKESVNYRLLQLGLAYPFFFANGGLFPDIRDEMAAAVVAARAAKLNIHKDDGTVTGVNVSSSSVITDTIPIFPRLFRRLAEFIDGDPVVLTSFLDFVRETKIRVIVKSVFGVTGLDNILELTGNNLRMIHQPEDLLFLS